MCHADDHEGSMLAKWMLCRQNVVPSLESKLGAVSQSDCRNGEWICDFSGLDVACAQRKKQRKSVWLVYGPLRIHAICTEFLS